MIAVMIPGFNIISNSDGTEGNQSRIHPNPTRTDDRVNITPEANNPEYSVTRNPRVPENQIPIFFSSLSI